MSGIADVILAYSLLTVMIALNVFISSDVLSEEEADHIDYCSALAIFLVWTAISALLSAAAVSRDTSLLRLPWEKVFEQYKYLNRSPWLLNTMSLPECSSQACFAIFMPG